MSFLLISAWSSSLFQFMPKREREEEKDTNSEKSEWLKILFLATMHWRKKDTVVTRKYAWGIRLLFRIFPGYMYTEQLRTLRQTTWENRACTYKYIHTRLGQDITARCSFIARLYTLVVGKQKIKASRYEWKKLILSWKIIAVDSSCVTIRDLHEKFFESRQLIYGYTMLLI